MADRRTVSLTDAQRQALVQFRDHDSRPYVRERCAAILKVADGLTAHAVAQHGLLRARDPDTIYRWLDTYTTAGLDGLLDSQHGGPRRRGL